MDSVTKEIVHQLAVYLADLMPDLQEVLEDWPEPNIALSYPALSIFTGEPAHRPFPPYLISQTDLIDNKISTKYVVGDYEWKMQLDMWCSSKFQRNSLYDKFYKAFNDQFISDETDVMGISLSLPNYHNTIARYDLLSYNFDDSEAGSQRKEWRIKFNILAHCKAILDREHYKVVTTELDSDISTSVVVAE